MGLLREFPGRAVAVDVSVSDWVLKDERDAENIESSGYAILFVGAGGNIKVDAAESGTAILFTNVPSGSELKLRVSKVYNADTTASDLVAIFE